MPTPVEKYSLPVMEAIEGSSELSQRDISEKTAISLGAVNAVLKDLVHRGWIRAQKIPRKRYAYYLTPQGIAEKTQLALNVFENTLQAYEKVRSMADTHAQRLAQEGHVQVALIGRGAKLELAYLACLQAGIKVEGIYDDSAAGKLALGFVIKKEAQLPVGTAIWRTMG
ncbi:winged helix-turn-helix transcriptional regulator [Kamptonema cortianum]|nr:winged helix-turn-helix transcriptional regulator [Oscillatoria laete-virens]MDK3155365.1 winged helix-turn-helix transcriptional regulator [Kamptonema cortianum]MDL5046114.1 winged helix-turn-helix transcriptional regulator [Oscillatoria amoena NRMC-F 0135]MDL5052815.1 winged helix-turn-helix transcriptional regulator [Oscillatoria laete-virens NRMC-F 0139]